MGPKCRNLNRSSPTVPTNSPSNINPAPGPLPLPDSSGRTRSTRASSNLKSSGNLPDNPCLLGSTTKGRSRKLSPTSMPEHEASNVPHVDGSTSAGDASNAPRAPSSSQPVSPQDVTSPRRLMPSRTKKNSNPVKSNSRRSHQQVMADNAAIQAKEKEIAEMMRAQMEELALLKASLCAEEKARETEAESEFQIPVEPDADDEGDKEEEEEEEEEEIEVYGSCGVDGGKILEEGEALEGGEILEGGEALEGGEGDEVQAALAEVEEMEAFSDESEYDNQKKKQRVYEANEKKGRKKGKKGANGKAAENANVTRSRAPAKSLASGLTQGFKNFLASSKKKVSEPEAPTIGGLRDSDAEGRAPAPGKTKVVKTNALVSLNSDEETAGAPAPNSRPIPLPKKGKDSSRSAPSKSGSRSQTPAESRTNSRTNSQTNSQTNSRDPTPDTPNPSASSQPNKAGKSKDLPSWINKAAWDSAFLPTFCNRILASRTPMSFKKDPELVAIIQDAIDIVFPGNSHKVKLHGDVIFEKAYDRMGNMQNRIGKRAYDLVQKYFKTDDKLRDDPAARLAFSQWAIQTNGGPMVYGRPIPQGSKKDDPNYVKPGQPFESWFITQMMRYIMSSVVKGSQGRARYGKVVGALALCTTALKRAFKWYIAKQGNPLTKIDNKFSEGLWAADVQQVMKLVDSIGDRRWDVLMDMYEVPLDAQVISDDNGPSPPSGDEEEYVVPSDAE